MTTPLAAYNFDEASGSVLNVGGSAGAGGDFSISGATVSRVAGHTSSGLRSTGSTAAMLPDIGRTTQRTIMAWLSFSGIVTSWPILFNVASLDSGGWGILYVAPDIAIQARNTTTFVRPTAAWDGGTHHVAGTFDGTAVRLYLDGVLQGAPVALTGPLRTDTDPPRLWSGTGAMASGYMDDLRLYDTALSQAEIVTAMNTPPAEDEPEPEPEPEPDPEPAVSVRGQGWQSLISIFDTAVAERVAIDLSAPVACPNDGEPLRVDPDGNLRCQWDGWVWDGRPIRYS